MKQFVKKLTSHFSVSSTETRVSVMTFSSHTQIAIRFSDKYSHQSSLNAAIDRISYFGGGTATALALTTAYNDMFSRRYGARGPGLNLIYSRAIYSFRKNVSEFL